MDFDQLAGFLEVAKHQSFSRAAQNLYRTQPAISAQVRLLEQEFGERLFDRSGKKVLLTPAGEILREYAEKLHQVQREALQAVAELHRTPRGKLHIGANEATCLYVLPRAFAQFKAQYPEVQINISRNFSHKILQKVQDGAVDLGILTLPLKANHVNVEVLPIFKDEIRLVVPPDHPLARNKKVSVEQMAGHPLIIPKTGHTRHMLERMLRAYRDRVQISMELASVETIKKFVGAGLGISVISRSYALPEVEAGLLRLIPFEGIKLFRELGLIYRNDRNLSLPAKAFIEVIRQVRSVPKVSTKSKKADSA